MLNCEIQCFLLKIRNNERICGLTTSSQHFAGCSRQYGKVIWRNKMDPDWKGSKTGFIHKCHVLLVPTEKLLQLIREFSKVSGYKVNI